MMDEDGSSAKPPSTRPKLTAAEEERRRKVTAATIMVMIILGAALVGFMVYQYIIASQTDVYVLDVEVEVKEVGGVVHIVRIDTNRRSMELLSSPRSDDLSIFPGVRAKLLRGQDVLSYDAFVSYKGNGVHNLVLGLRHPPRENEILTCTSWIFTGNQGLYSDDQESAVVVWSDARITKALKASISMEGSLETGSNAQITSVDITQNPSTLEIGNDPSYYPGVYGYVMKNDEYVSFVATESYDPPGNYTLYIGLLFEPQQGDRMSVIIEVWQRNGEWLEGEYQSVTDSHSQAYAWGE
ncbi:MAG: hypothetical protein JSW28_00025 [Thermoplasmata archaeon]|nr:MAG: hypothetical protein JSW28_00025 [Thermoplasmata archaeon]